MTRRVLALGVGAVTAAAAYRAAGRLTPALRRPWERRNHAGRTVTLLEGPAHVLGLAAAGSLAGPAPVVAALGAGAFGALDDLAGDATAKGLRGHLAAVRRGRVTTGLVKIVGLAGTGLVAARLASRGSLTHTLAGGAVIAGTANVVNLLDLRPGRALKAGLLAAVPLTLAGGPGALTAAGTAGAALGVLRPDLAGTAMLGDTGANALGAVLGTALVTGSSTRTRLLALAVLVSLTLASERVSFTTVIESTPGLRALDAWGRPPA